MDKYKWFEVVNSAQIYIYIYIHVLEIIGG